MITVSGYPSIDVIGKSILVKKEDRWIQQENLLGTLKIIEIKLFLKHYIHSAACCTNRIYILLPGQHRR